MKRAELHELHYITALDNVASILKRGILSFRRAQTLAHTSIAMDEIQQRRAKVIVPGGRGLHEYACLYICGRNVMLYKRRDQHENICVVRVSPDVLDLPGVVVTNGNASSDYVRFAAAPAGLRIVDEELTFAEFWTHENPVEYYRRKCAKCAEVLVPNRISPEYIMGAHVSSENARDALREIDEDIKIKLSPGMFFL